MSEENSNDNKIVVLETKVIGIQDDIKELYKRSDETNNAINNLNVSIAKLSGSLDTFSYRLDISIKNLGNNLEDKIKNITCDVNKIASKTDEEDNREKRNTDSVKVGVIMTIIGVVIGAVAGIIGLNK